MKKGFKVVRVVLVVVVVLIVAAALLIHFFADRAVKIGIEAGGTKALSVGVKVDDVDLSILGGKIAFKNLLIDNPPGYEHERFLALKDAQIEVDLASLMSDVVNIKNIKMDGVDLTLEQKGITSNNLKDIIKSIPSSDEQPSEPSGKKLHIDNLELTNVTANVKLLPVPGKPGTVTVKLSPIRMTDLGTDNKLDIATLSGKILLAIAGGIAQQGADLLPVEMLTSVTDELKRLEAVPEALLKEGTELLKQTEDIGKDVIKQGEDIGKGITEGLKGLLQPKKEEEEK